MTRYAKADWPACALCGQPDGPITGAHHVTPSRYSISQAMVAVLTATEKFLLKDSVVQQICKTCRDRLNQRIHRASA